MLPHSSPSLESEEGDIGTVRNIQGHAWIPRHLRPDTSDLSPKSHSNRLASSSVPDIPKAVIVEAQKHNLPSSPRAPKTVHISTSEPDLPALFMTKAIGTRRWILGLAVVDFDLDQGPVLSRLYPPFKIPAECRENIAFSSFPDSSTFEVGSQIHSFKLTGLNAEEENIPCDAYGFSYFVQRRDTTSRRGYLQRSIVIISQYPYPSLMERLVSILGPLYVLHGSVLLESVCQSISSWPEPTPGSALELGFLGHALKVSIPNSGDETQFHDAMQTLDPSSHILVSIPPRDPFPISLFSSCLSSLWSIWELLILCEPILVYGPNPRITSSAIWWLRDMLRPIPLFGDFRPYVTIHERDYSMLFNKNPPKAGLVVGVTNPFILSVTRHWPHILSLSVEDRPYKRTKPAYDKVAQSKPAIGYVTQTHKRYTSKDRHLLKTWEQALEKGGNFESFAATSLRRHFSSRTAAFLAPLSRYLYSLIPTPAETNSSRLPLSPRSKGRLKPFNNADFLASLKANGTPLPFKSSTKQREFYERWLRTPAFGLWLAKQDDVVSGVLKDSQSRA